MTKKTVTTTANGSSGSNVAGCHNGTGPSCPLCSNHELRIHGIDPAEAGFCGNCKRYAFTWDPVNGKDEIIGHGREAVFRSSSTGLLYVTDFSVILLDELTDWHRFGIDFVLGVLDRHGYLKLTPIESTAWLIATSGRLSKLRELLMLA